MAFDYSELAKAIKARRLAWSRHVLERLRERGIPRQAVISILLTGEPLEEYRDDTPYPSALFLARYAGRPLHVVVAFDEKRGWAYVVTAYEPDGRHFEDDYRTRRRKA